MTIAKTLRKFEELKSAILADGKVDIDEVEVLLDFIAPYCRARNQKFEELHKLLVLSREDGKITKEESESLIAAIENVAEFLRNEKKIETFLVWFMCVGIIVVFTFAFVQHLTL